MAQKGLRQKLLKRLDADRRRDAASSRAWEARELAKILAGIEKSWQSRREALTWTSVQIGGPSRVFGNSGSMPVSSKTVSAGIV